MTTEPAPGVYSPDQLQSTPRILSERERGGWQPIETAPRDGTIILALYRSRWMSESRIEVVWWQPEFEAFISGCREMQMHNGYTFGDGSTRQLHSPDILPATHWLCVVPAISEAC